MEECNVLSFLKPNEVLSYPKGKLLLLLLLFPLTFGGGGGGGGCIDVMILLLIAVKRKITYLAKMRKCLAKL